MGLWRLEFFVQGKHLEETLTFLANRALDMKPPQPVEGAIVKHGRIIEVPVEEDEPYDSAPLKEGTLRAKVLNAVEAMAPHTTITTTEIRELVLKFGGAPATYHTTARDLMEAKLIKRRARGVFYRVKG
jgi:hypothetical protein